MHQIFYKFALWLAMMVGMLPLIVWLEVVCIGKSHNSQCSEECCGWDGTYAHLYKLLVNNCEIS